MLQLKYNSEFLDIEPAEDTELEKNSPLFLGLETILAEYSTPIALKYSEKNVRLIGYLFFDLTARTKSTFDVEIYDSGTFISPATLVIESAGMNTRFYAKSRIAGYLLTGISSFFSYIKDQKLSDLDLGGERSIPYTTSDPTDGTNGFWQQFQNTWQYEDDYVVVPAKNLAFTEDDPQFAFSNNWMNKLDANNNLDTRQPIVPWPKLEYVLTQIMEENGWHLDTTGLNDDEWKKLLVYSMYLVQTNFYNYVGGNLVASHYSNVIVDLAKAMPQDVTCSRFILEVCKKYFWFPITDLATRTVKLIALKESGNKTPKDWTKYADPASTSDFSATNKIFAFKNTFEGDDQYPDPQDLSEWSISEVTTYEDLPDLISGNYEGILYFVFTENKYYQEQNDGTKKVWVPFTDNIYDEDTSDATDTYETAVTTLPIVRTQFDNGKWGYVPVVNQEQYSKWGMRTVLFHGMTPQFDDSGNAVAFFYPYASCINSPHLINPQLPWSNVLKHTDFVNEYGIIEYWAQKWLDMTGSGEVIQRNFYLPLHELIKFEWDDIILVHNIAYFVKSYIQGLGYKGFIQAKLQRIKLSA